MKPKISIIIPTYRVGGLDILVNSLNNQTFKDFELVLVDGIFKYRKDIFKNKKVNFEIQHVEPIENPFPVAAFCRYSNTGLVHAKGEIILFAADYTWFPPNCVEKHVKLQSIAPDDKRGLMSPHIYIEIKENNIKLNPVFPTYLAEESEEGKASTKKYAEDVKTMPQNLMWSLFDTEFNEDPANPKFVKNPIDVKLNNKWKVSIGGFNAKNESCKLQRVLEINGWDEDLDGTNGWQDYDLVQRLKVEWAYEASNPVYILNPRGVFSFPIRKRSYWTNESIYMSKRIAGFRHIPNSWIILARKNDIAP